MNANDEYQAREALEERDHCTCGASLNEDDPSPVCWDCRPLNQFEKRRSTLGSEVG